MVGIIIDEPDDHGLAGGEVTGLGVGDIIVYKVVVSTVSFALIHRVAGAENGCRTKHIVSSDGVIQLGAHQRIAIQIQGLTGGVGQLYGSKGTSVLPCQVEGVRNDLGNRQLRKNAVILFVHLLQNDLLVSGKPSHMAHDRVV